MSIEIRTTQISEYFWDGKNIGSMNEEQLTEALIALAKAYNELKSSMVIPVI